MAVCRAIAVPHYIKQYGVEFVRRLLEGAQIDKVVRYRSTGASMRVPCDIYRALRELADKYNARMIDIVYTLARTAGYHKLKPTSHKPKLKSGTKRLAEILNQYACLSVAELRTLTRSKYITLWYDINRLVALGLAEKIKVGRYAFVCRRDADLTAHPAYWDVVYSVDWKKVKDRSRHVQRMLHIGIRPSIMSAIVRALLTYALERGDIVVEHYGDEDIDMFKATSISQSRT